MIHKAIDEVRASAEQLTARMEAVLPRDFPEVIHASVQAAVASRLERLATVEST